MARIEILSGISWAALFERKERWLAVGGRAPGRGSSDGGGSGGALVVIPRDWRLDRKTELLRNHLEGCHVLTTEELIGGYLRRLAGGHPEISPPAPCEELTDGAHTAGILLDRHAAAYLLDSILKDSALAALQELEPAEPARSQTGYLNIETFRQGYLRALCEYIVEFRQTHREDLLAVLESARQGTLSAKDRDLVDIHEEFERLLEKRGLYDYRRGVRAFVENRNQEQGPPAPFSPETRLVVAGFSRLNSLDRLLLLGLLHRFQHATILHCSNPRTSAAVFRVQESLESMLQEVRDSPVDLREQRLEEPAPYRGPALLPLGELLFQDDKQDRLFRDSGAVTLIQAEDRYREVTLMARQILELGRQGVEYGRMRLAFSDHELYAAILLEVFPRYGIPYRLNKGTPLRLFPLAGILQSLVAHAVSPNPYPLRERILCSPYVSFSCPVDADALHRFALEKGIAVKRETIRAAIPEPRAFDLDYRWCLEQQRRAARAVKSAQKLEPLGLAARYLEERFAGDPPTRERKILKLLKHHYVLSQAERSLYLWRSRMTPSAFCRGLRKLMDRFHIEENLRIRGGGAADQVLEIVMARDQGILEKLDLLFERFQAHFGLLGGGGRDEERQYGLLTLSGAFTSLLSDPELALASPSPDGVGVFACSDVPVSFYPVTLVGGLVDGEFPAREPFNFLAPRSEGPGEESLLIDQDRQNLYQLMAATTERLYLYVPFSDGGRRLLSSPFVAEVERCLASAAKRRRQQEPADDSGPCCNSREKLVFAGRNLDRAYSKALPVLQELKSISAEGFRHILEVFRCDGLRGSPEALSRFDGVFEPSGNAVPVAAGSIRRQMDEAAFIEVEQLERYAGCPLRFLFDDLMGLKPDYQVDYHPDRTDRGLLIRAILCEYSAAAAAAVPFAPAAAGTQGAPEALGAGRTPENPEALLRSIAEQAITRMPSGRNDLFSGSFERSLLRGLAGAAHGPATGTAGESAGDLALGTTGDVAAGRTRPGLLRAYLDHERQASDLLLPYLAALELGGFRAAGIRLRISIERADVTSGGEYLIIYAYSISDPGDPGAVNRGLRFLAPLSILALRHHLQVAGSDKQVGGSGAYLVRNPRTIKRGGYFALKSLQAPRKSLVSPQRPLFSGQRQYGFLPEANFEKELEQAEGRVGRIDALIRQGRFNPPLCAVKDQICPNCAFSRICRKDQLRLDKIYTAVDEQQLYKPRRKIELPECELELEA